jgi:hypothetical protein
VQENLKGLNLNGLTQVLVYSGDEGVNLLEDNISIIKNNIKICLQASK